MIPGTGVPQIMSSNRQLNGTEYKACLITNYNMLQYITRCTNVLIHAEALLEQQPRMATRTANWFPIVCNIHRPSGSMFSANLSPSRLDWNTWGSMLDPEICTILNTLHFDRDSAYLNQGSSR